MFLMSTETEQFSNWHLPMQLLKITSKSRLSKGHYNDNKRGMHIKDFCFFSCFHIFICIEFSISLQPTTLVS